jgi:hypothetical protein
MLQKIKDAGFDVKPEELVNTVGGKEGELNDEQLEAVAGGSFWGDFWTGFKYGIVDPIGAMKEVIDTLK